MNEWDKEQLDFSKQTRRGLLVLLIVFILFAVSPRLYRKFINPPPKSELIVQELGAIGLQQEKAENQEKEKGLQKHQLPTEKFNPNHTSKEEWIAMGLSEKQAQSILNYLNTGATLKIKSDVKKLYGISDELYADLLPLIDLPEEFETTKRKEKKQIEKEKTTHSSNKENREDKESIPTTPISINLATKEELIKIPGIGDFFASEIIKIRESYGGIIDFNQLLTIYRMDEERLENLTPYFYIDTDEVNRLNINTATEAELRSHPLISSDMAKSIVYFRENHKPYENLNGLLISPYIDGKKLRELKPFLRY